MRFLLYDGITKLEKGKSIEGYKTFSLSDESLGGHFRNRALIPGALLIESMAQVLGCLIIYSHDFKHSALMSLIENVSVSSSLRPGFKAEIHAEITSISAKDTLGTARILVDRQTVASIGRIIYAHTWKADEDELRRMFSYYTGLSSTGMAE